MVINEIKKMSIISVLVITLVLGLTEIVFVQSAAAEKAGDKIRRRSVMKEVQGEVTWIRKDRIAIVFARNEEQGTEEEILLPIDAGVKLEQKQKLQQIEVGDTVAIQFEEVTEEGRQEGRMTRKAKVVRFIRKGAPPKPTSAPGVPEKKSEVLGSE